MFFDRLGSDDWRIRRRIVLLLLTWSTVMVTYIAIFGPPDQLREAIATALILLIGSLVGSYVFGVIWDSKGKQPGSTTSIQQTVVTKDESPNPNQPDPDPPPGYA